MNEDQREFRGESRDAPEAPILAVGGLDPGGGAGLVRDFLTAEALGARAFLVGTAFTLQTAGGVARLEPRSPSVLAQDLTLAVTAFRPAAVKVGMVGNGALAAAVVDGLAGFAGPVVFDPVLGASRGGTLYQGDTAGLGPLIARATLVTPNLDEAAFLSGIAVSDRASARQAAAALLQAGAAAVLVKGGHYRDGGADDLLITAAGEREFPAPRLPGMSPRGTGCSLATAIAIGLGRGHSLEDAIASAKHWLWGAIAAARTIGDERRL